MLHATIKPGDECPIQRLDYDRTNLLKNHPSETEFVLLSPGESVTEIRQLKETLFLQFLCSPV